MNRHVPSAKPVGADWQGSCSCGWRGALTDMVAAINEAGDHADAEEGQQL